MLMIGQRFEQHGGVSVSALLAGVFCLLFIGASSFGIWAFMESQHYKNDVDAIVDKESALAVQAAESEKDKEFAEKEKLPTRTFTGSQTYGSVAFDYPKTWSIYKEESSKGSVVNVYAHPGAVPGLSSGQPYALRLEITSTGYDKEAGAFNGAIEKGELRGTSYRPEKVEVAEAGLRLDGTLRKEVSGSMVLLRLRDRTIKLYTESTDYINDFNDIILPSLTFIP